MTPPHTTKARRLVSLFASCVATVSLVVGGVVQPASAVQPALSVRPAAVAQATASRALTTAASTAPENLSATPTPLISGTLAVGSTLTVTTGSWLPAVVTLTNQWLRSGVVIPGATASTYVLSAADLGKAISVSVTGSKAGYLSITQVSAASVPVILGTLSLTPSPTIAGSTVVGAQLTASAGTWGPLPVAYAYQWYRGATRIGGATAATYSIAAIDLGSLLSVAVTGSNPGFTPVTKSSAKTAAITAAVFALSPVPTISGTTVVGQTLTALPGTWALAPVDFGYEWNRDGLPISGAPQTPTYTLTNADAGTRISVTVTGSKAGFSSVSRLSAQTDSVLRALTGTPFPIISGTATVAATLTATPGSWAPGLVNLAYSWKRGSTTILGASSASYILAPADLGQLITVTVVGSRDGYASVTKSSVATTAVAPALLTLSPRPTVTGGATVGETLTADAGTWAPSPVGLRYQWKRGATTIVGATTSSYTLTAADQGFTVSVTVTGVKAGYTSITRSSAVTAPVQAGVLSATPTPTISGSAVVGATLTAASAAWAPATVTLSYVWLRDTTVISGATVANYTLTGAELGAEITVIVTGSKAGYTSATTVSDPTVPVVAATFTRTAIPVIAGIASVGQTLTANPGVWAPLATAITYRWMRNGVAIDGSPNAASYVISTGDLGAEITVSITGSRSGYASRTFTSDPTEPVLDVFSATPRPTIAGTVVVGQTLTATSGSWRPSPVNLAYQWLRGSTAIGGAASASYTLTPGDSGKAISVVVTGTKAGFTPAAMTSLATVLVAPGTLTATPVPTITGTARVGETLTAAAGSWQPATVSLSYQWKRGTTAISGANLATYLLTIADQGEIISVAVTGAKDGYTAVVKTSGATVAVAAAILTASPVPIVSGTARVGQLLTGTTGSWAPLPVALAYQWYRGTVAIIGATSSVYTLVPGDAGKAITLAVTGSKDGYASITRTSVATALIEASPLTAAPTPIIGGTPALGNTLTATAGTWLPAVVTLTYQWNRAGAPIDGATSPTYVVAVVDVGFALTVSVTGTKTGYTAETKTSALTVRIPSAALTSAPTPTIAGVAVFGHTLTATSGTWLPAPLTLSYQWNRGDLPIDGATASTYLLGPDDVGETLSVTTTGTKPGYASQSRTSTSSATVILATFTTTPTPTVTGTRAVGSTLTGVTTAWSPAPDVLEYQWLRDGEPITDANGLTYLVSADDAATVITFSVTASSEGYTPATRVSVAGTAIPGQDYALAQVPVISGDAVVGSMLTADPGTWDPVPDSFTYVWKRGTTVIADETSDTYVLTAADLGARITVTATGVLARYNVTARVSVATAPVAAGTLVVDTAPTITGDPTTGQVLTVDPGVWLPDSVTFTYVWKRDDVAIIPAKTLATYTVVTADEGHELTVVVTGHATGYANLPVTTDPVSPLAPTAFDTAPIPEVTGDAIVGETLTVDAGTWAPVPDSLSYLWKRGGVAIVPAATDTSYVLTSADAGSAITVTVTAVLATYASTSATSVPTSSVLRVLTATPIPTITGTLAVGSLLTAIAGTWSPTPVGLTYEWSSNGTPIDAPSSSTYRLVATDLDAVITVAVTGTKTGYAPVTKSSADSDAVVAGAFTTTPTPTVTGTSTVGSTLTGTTTAWSPAPDLLDYQWLRNGDAITDAKDLTYVLVADDIGATVTFSVTASRDGYTTASRVSAAGSTISAQAFTATVVPLISGGAIVGETLTADPGAWDPVPDSFSYVWKRGTSVIADEISDTHVVTVADAGFQVTVTATATKMGYITTSTTSARTSAVLDVLTDTPTPIISGTAAVGELLTVDAGTWLPATVELNYSWFRGVDPIEGESASTHRLVAADLGALITVAVTGIKSGCVMVTKTSDPTALIAEGTFSSTPAPTITGIAANGETLVSNVSGWTPLATGMTYQWTRGGVAIEFATHGSYTLTSDDVGATITVTVTGTRDGYSATPATSGATDAVVNVFTAGTVSIVGDPTVGTSLAVDLGTWSPADGTPHYQWFRDSVAITDEVGGSYTLVDADLGTTLSVAVTVTKTGYRTAEASATLAIPAP